MVLALVTFTLEVALTLAFALTLEVAPNALEVEAFCPPKVFEAEEPKGLPVLLP